MICVWPTIQYGGSDKIFTQVLSYFLRIFHLVVTKRQKFWLEHAPI